MILKTAQDVLENESQSITAAAAKLDQTLESCVNSLNNISGKIVVCGMGKSGHIGKKIAATLASTGSPAFFLHATEAEHGDMGMIQPNDALIAISYSGKTSELVNVCKFAKRQGVYIVAITGSNSSPLAELSDFTLDAGVTAEADDFNIVPTASSTVALALGDALAITLMKIKGFKSEDFRQLHPNGSLGQRLTKVSDVMQPIGPNEMAILSDSIESILNKINESNFGIVGLHSNMKLVGCITDGDIRRSIIRHKNIENQKTEDVMSKKPKTILQDTPAISTVQMIEEYSITDLFVVDSNQKVVGLLRLHDLMKAKII